MSFCWEKDDSPVGRMKFARWERGTKGRLQDIRTKLLFLLSFHHVKFVCIQPGLCNSWHLIPRGCNCLRAIPGVPLCSHRCLRVCLLPDALGEQGNPPQHTYLYSCILRDAFLPAHSWCVCTLRTNVILI